MRMFTVYIYVCVHAGQARCGGVRNAARLSQRWSPYAEPVGRNFRL